MARAIVDTALWIRRFHPDPDSEVRLVCLPHAGGSASFYYPVSESLRPGVEVLAVQYPGRQDRRSEPCVDTVDVLADRIVSALEPWVGDKPLALFGHSMGATLAFEVARGLERRGTAPVALFASGRRAPSRYRDDQVHLRDDDGIVAELQLLSGTDSRLLGNEDLLRLVIPVIRADYKAVETYRCEPGARVSCPVTVLVGDSDPKATIEEARAWSEHTTGAFDLQVYPGGHFYLSTHQDEVTDLISARLTGYPPPLG
ncbi:alpha/beta fold hydrolase [Umezawaea sp. Da 62-37]|uniref:thioesterase II family protein n=1 Tax=Umezawaea sp. Da 62-37 TaxID=3075927 RepID=UPI0028F7492A|nr:alpha/beta fold hydrolase [Umezawaea sp. Da 62-37]WNV84060.1 alpha/beta fold hydrolase [Umezawaea sp. Da 62-37]